LARREVRTETASRARRDTLLAQDGAEHHRKMTAYAGHTAVGLARLRKRPRIESTNPRQHIADRTNVRIVALLFGKLQVVEKWSDIPVNEHTLYDLAQRADLARKFLYLRSITAEVGHRSFAFVIFLRLFHGSNYTPVKIWRSFEVVERRNPRSTARW